MPRSKDLSLGCPGTRVSWLRLFMWWCQVNVCMQRTLSAHCASEHLVRRRLFFWTIESRNIVRDSYASDHLLWKWQWCEMGRFHHSLVFKAKLFSFIFCDVSCMVFHSLQHYSFQTGDIMYNSYVLKKEKLTLDEGFGEAIFTNLGVLITVTDSSGSLLAKDVVPLC